MLTKKTITLASPNDRDDLHRLFDAERDTPTLPSQLPEAPSLDAELAADPFDLRRRRLEVPSDVPRVDTGRLVATAVIHNAFWVAGKVPSLNDLLDAKSAGQPLLRSIIMRQKPVKGKRGGNRYCAYNDIKQDWKTRTVRAVGSPFVRIERAYFGYVIVEETLKRDPSNVCSAAIKFIEDGLVTAGVIPNDGWNNVLGIRMVCLHRPGRQPGVYVVMSDKPLDESRLAFEYEESQLGAESF